MDAVGAVIELRGGGLHGIAYPRGVSARLFEVDAIATAFLLLSRGCLERMTEAFGSAMFDYVRDEDGGTTGEDFAFFCRWRGLGGKVHADPFIRTRHHADGVRHAVVRSGGGGHGGRIRTVPGDPGARVSYR